MLSSHSTKLTFLHLSLFSRSSVWPCIKPYNQWDLQLDGIMPTWKLILSIILVLVRQAKTLGLLKRSFWQFQSLWKHLHFFQEEDLEHWALCPDSAQDNAKGRPPASPMSRKPKILMCYQSTTDHAGHRKHFEHTCMQEKSWFPLNLTSSAAP